MNSFYYFLVISLTLISRVLSGTKSEIDTIPIENLSKSECKSATAPISSKNPDSLPLTASQSPLMTKKSQPMKLEKSKAAIKIPPSKTMIERMKEYGHGKHVQDAYNKVMKKLQLSGNKRKDLEFCNLNFFEKLIPEINSKKFKFPQFNLFWGDLTKLFFKHILYLKQKEIQNGISVIENNLKKIQSLVSIICENYFQFIPCNFQNFKTMNAYQFDLEFLNSEFFEHSNYLASRFADALNYFYSPLFHKEGKREEIDKEKIKEITCQEFRDKFFENGNPNNDILLNFFMTYYDYRGRVIRICLESNIKIDYLDTSEESIKEIENDIKELKSKGVEHFTGIPTMKYATNSIMNFILLNRRKIFIKDKVELVHFLQRIAEANMANTEKIKGIVEFKSNDSSPDRWNEEIFESYLIDYGKNGTPDECNFCNKILSSFELPSIDCSSRK